MTRKIIRKLYYECCDYYYHWYNHEDSGFRLSRIESVVYQTIGWVFLLSEELYWILRRAEQPENKVLNAVLSGTSVAFFLITTNINSRKKRFISERDAAREPADSSAC